MQVLNPVDYARNRFCLLLYCCCFTAAALLLLLYCCCCTAAALLLLLYCCCFTAALLLLCCQVSNPVNYTCEPN
jgi:hypothetical protein